MQPSQEICDGAADEDCDGLPDAQDPDCECINGMSDTCAVQNAKGICAAGMHTCENGKWGTCIGPSPRQEVCDGKPIDEDCDGSNDNGCDCENGKSQSCTDSSDPCAHGTQTCSAGQWSSCKVNTKCSSDQKCVNGSCKQWCTQAACDAMSKPCQTSTCSQTSGQCELHDAAIGSGCTPETQRGGQCVENHVCAPIVNIRVNAYGTYVSATDVGPGYVKGYQSSPAAWERFLLIRSSPSSTTVAFKSLRSNRYVVPVAPPPLSDSDQWGGATSDPSMWANKDSQWLGSNGSLTNFTLSTAALNSTTSIGVPGGSLWSCDDWGNKPIRLSSTTVGDWEKYTIEPTD